MNVDSDDVQRGASHWETTGRPRQNYVKHISKTLLSSGIILFGCTKIQAERYSLVAKLTRFKPNRAAFSDCREYEQATTESAACNNLKNYLKEITSAIGSI